MKRTNTIYTATLFLLLISGLFQLSYAQVEADFYEEKINNVNVTIDLVADYGVNNSDTKDDSPLLQKAIDDIAKAGKRGKITLKKGTYYLSNIELKSNIHLVIEENTVIIPQDPGNDKNYKVFTFGGNKATVGSISIRSTNKKFIVDLSKVRNPNVAVITLLNVDNFYISGMKVIDNNTKFSAITFGYSTFENKYYKPRNGVVRNCHISNAHYGYGLVQSQAAKNVFFKNISGSGGVTLRLETGYSKMNALQVGGNFDIYGKKISSKNGNATVMISPHAIKNGHVEIDDVTAINSGFAVRIGNGYTTKDQAVLGLKPGYFASTSKVTNIKATYGKTAQVKAKHFKYMPCAERGLIADDYNPDGESYTAPAIAPVLNAAEGNGQGYYNVTLQNVSGSGFKNLSKNILFENDSDTCSGTSNARNIDEEVVNQISVYPNPSNGMVYIKNLGDNTLNTIVIRNSNGQIIEQGVNLNSTIDLSKYNSGIYFIRINNETHKVIIK
ncbi:T9SS type A sorting domain-containing protein [Flammeovirga pectinis]|uniref:T9SS type A sorting domain-containing protein n=1 Tax=Flammeovirga pectinis TaxID=2494373 RepID=A0A3S9NZ31_9BACT|nr:T9SS type A sorting domain-containing protein [Flammeovirga pectinis]AZQ61184.1 T9SS type A sorting domain-containing protein [Flammeovirga pectinis]